MILVGGGSWAYGEWHDDPAPHRGLSQYLSEAGWAVENLGYLRGQNIRTLGTLQQWLDQHRQVRLERIFVFQTDYTCDFLEPVTWQHIPIDSVDSLQDFSLDRFYNTLAGFAQQANCPVHVIGGMGDAQDPELVARTYPGVTVACQSMVNLLINGQACVDQPVHGWFTTFNLKLFKHLKSVLDYTESIKLLDRIEQSMQRELDMADCQAYFWPDRFHPNRAGHRRLFEYLDQQGYLA